MSPATGPPPRSASLTSLPSNPPSKARILLAEIGEKLSTWSQRGFKFYYTRAKLPAEIAQAFFGTLAFVLTVSTTYHVEGGNVPNKSIPGFLAGFWIVNLALLSEFCFKLFIAADLLRFFMSLETLVDIALVFPPMFMSPTTSIFYVFQACRLIKTERLLRLLENESGSTVISSNTLNQHLRWRVLHIVHLLFVILCLTGTILCLIEDDNITSFDEGVYFTVSTVTTVGYGDVYPTTVWGQVFVLCTIMFSFLVLPGQIAALASAVGSMRNQHLGGSGGDRFVLVVGDVTAKHIEGLSKDFFCPNHIDIAVRAGYGVNGLRLKFVSPKLPTAAVKDCFYDPVGKERIEYIVGDATNKHDLEKVKADKALAIIVLSSDVANGWFDSDSRVITSSVCMLKLCPGIRIFADVFSEEHQVLLEHAGAEYCQSFAKFRGAIVGGSLKCPTFSTLILNLIDSSEVDVSRTFLEPWQDEYVRGRKFEIYACTLPDAFAGMTFAGVVQNIYAETGNIVIGVETDHVEPKVVVTKGRRSEDAFDRCRIVINPAGDVVVESGAVIFLIANEQPQGMDMVLSLAGENEAREGRRRLAARRFIESGVTITKPTPADMQRMGVEDGGDFEAHFLVIGPMGGSEYLLESLRNDGGGGESGVVLFVYHEPPNEETLRDIATRFSRVYYMIGKGDDVGTLNAAGITKARAVYVRRQEMERVALGLPSWGGTVQGGGSISGTAGGATTHGGAGVGTAAGSQTQQGQPTISGGAGGGQRSADLSEPVQISLAIEQALAGCESRPHCLIDTFDVASAAYVSYTYDQGTVNSEQPFDLAPAYASGRIITYERWASALMAQLIIKPYMRDILDILLFGQTVEDTASGTLSCGTTKIEDVPEEMHYKTFAELFNYYVNRGCICVALVHEKDNLRSPMEYINSCPNKETVLRGGDRAVLIASFAWDGAPASM